MGVAILLLALLSTSYGVFNKAMIILLFLYGMSLLVVRIFAPQKIDIFGMQYLPWFWPSFFILWSFFYFFAFFRNRVFFGLTKKQQKTVQNPVLQNSVQQSTVEKKLSDNPKS